MSNENPASISNALTAIPGRFDEPLPVSPGTRFGNYLLDIIFNYAFIFLLLIVLRLIGIAFSPEDKLVYYSFFLSATYLYYFFFEVLFGRTFGKMITGCKVVTNGGGRPGAGQIALRTICRFIPFEAFSFFGGPIGWHDSLSKTLVVKSR